MLLIFGGLIRAFWDSHRFGYAAAFCSTVAEFWRPDFAQHSMRGDPGCGVFGLLKISIGEKQAPNKELATGSIQRSPAVRKPESHDPMAAFLVAPAVAQSTQRSTRSTTADPSLIPLPRPRPKRL
jgi:hypothetical protein